MAALAAFGSSQTRGWIGAIAPDPTFLCALWCGSCQSWSLNPLSEARDGTHMLLDSSWILNPLIHNGNSWDYTFRTMGTEEMTLAMKLVMAHGGSSFQSHDFHAGIKLLTIKCSSTYLITGVPTVAQQVKNSTQYPWGWGVLCAALKRQKQMKKHLEKS